MPETLPLAAESEGEVVCSGGGKQLTMTLRCASDSYNNCISKIRFLYSPEVHHLFKKTYEVHKKYICVYLSFFLREKNIQYKISDINVPKTAKIPFPTELCC